MVLDRDQHLFKLRLRANQRPVVLDRFDVLEQGDSRPGDRAHRLASGIRDQMEVKTLHGTWEKPLVLGITARCPRDRENHPRYGAATPFLSHIGKVLNRIPQRRV